VVDLNDPYTPARIIIEISLSHPDGGRNRRDSAESVESWAGGNVASPSSMASPLSNVDEYDGQDALITLVRPPVPVGTVMPIVSNSLSSY